MPEFLLELYVPGADAVAEDTGPCRVRRAAEELAAEGRPIRHVRSMFVAAEETCFELYEAASVSDVEAAAARAGVTRDRIVHALTSATALAD